MKIRRFLQKYFIIFPPKSVFSRFSEKPDPEFFSLKPPRDQAGANKKKFSKIGPAVPELLRDTHTGQTHRQKPLLLCSIDGDGFEMKCYPHCK